MIAEVLTKKDKKRDVEKRYTLEEYFELEERAAYKSEFRNGRIVPIPDSFIDNNNDEKIIPMAGGTINHGMIGSTIHALLFMLFFNSDDEIDVFSSDQKIYLEEYHKNVYSDTCVVKGKTATYNNGNQAILNPTLIVEVASKSTEKYDRTGKFRMYQSLPSFTEYVLVSQEAPIIEVLYKMAENKWQLTSYVGLDKVVILESLGVELKMSDIYKKAEDLKDPQFAIDFPEDEKL